MTCTEKKSKSDRRAYSSRVMKFEFDETAKVIIKHASTMAVAYRAAQGKPVEFDQRKKITDAAIEAYVHADRTFEILEEKQQELQRRVARSEPRYNGA